MEKLQETVASLMSKLQGTEEISSRALLLEKEIEHEKKEAAAARDRAAHLEKELAMEMRNKENQRAEAGSALDQVRFGMADSRLNTQLANAHITVVLGCLTFCDCCAQAREQLKSEHVRVESLMVERAALLERLEGLTELHQHLRSLEAWNQELRQKAEEADRLIGANSALKV